MVCIPEGLPLAVSLAMALSTSSLKKDEILIKNLESVQTCAMLHELLISKTGTLTKGKLDVVKYQLFNQGTVSNDSDKFPDSFNKELGISNELKDIVKETIISNTDVRIECNDKGSTPFYEPKGQELEVGLIQFLMDNEEDVTNMFINRNRFAPKVVQLPFDQEFKRKIVVRQVQEQPDTVRVYIKGAPEYIIPICS